MDYSARLESDALRKGYEGSNPSPSAKIPLTLTKALLPANLYCIKVLEWRHEKRF